MPSDQTTPLSAFLTALRNDVDADSVRPLAEYLARFPGDEEGIAREYFANRGRLARGASGATPEGASDSESFGHFVLRRELGRGGQGAVYLAEDTRLGGRQVALKILPESGPAAESRLRRFRREAEITARLDHPGVATVLDSGFVGGVAYIAMKYVPGRPLSTLIAESSSGGPETPTTFTASIDATAADAKATTGGGRGAEGSSASEAAPPPPTELDRRLRLIEASARALHAAHEAGVVHRDVKPANIMVTPSGEPVILDFGLAYDESDDGPLLTQTGDLFGTPAYMSPEQITAQRIKLDRRTDVYSLGVVLFESVTSRRPFDAPTREGLYQAILTKDPPDIRRLNPSVQTDLRVVVETALEKDRDRRYATALDFAEELRRVREREPILAKPAGPIVKLVRWTQRKPALAASLIGLFLALSAGLATSLHFLGKRDEALREKTDALGLATAERNAKSAALDDYDRLGDVSRLSRLVKEADGFWPAEPTKVEAMRRWLTEAGKLEDNLEGHRLTLDELRASPEVLPYTDTDRAADAPKLRPLAERREAAANKRVAVAANLTAAESRAASRVDDSSPATRPDSRPSSQPSVEDLRAAMATLDAEIGELDVRLSERLTWRFATEASQFKHDTIGKLADDLAAFLDPDPHKGSVASVKKRLSFAESVENETLKKHAEKWAVARASIADPAQCPKYAGFKLAPQLGLIPIRKDPHSGLWEFAHLQTTAEGVDPIPAVRADGRYDLKETTGLIFVLIPGGTFQMGARRPTADELADAEAEGGSLPPNVDPSARSDEGPVHAVTLDPYFLSKYELTQAQWTRLVGPNPSYYRRDNPTVNRFGDKLVTPMNPVEQISWEECSGDAGWIRRLGLDLPTEAQWEYACRAGTTTPWWTGSKKGTIVGGGNVAEQYCLRNGGSPSWSFEAWDDGYTVHAPIGLFAPNAYGLHDTIGNVWEWCRDGSAPYGPDNWRKRDGLRDAGPSSSTRVARGGAFSSVATMARSSFRNGTAPGGRSDNLGVRPSKGCHP